MRSIYLTGSSGTGKTTQSLILADVLRMQIVDGISRTSPYLMGTSDHQQYVSRRVFKKCMQQVAVHCRTPYCVHAYTQVNGVESPMDEQYMEVFSATNPLVIYFPMLGEIEDDGFRPTDYEFNQSVDKHIKDSLEAYNVKHLTLSLGSPRDRAKEIVKYLLEETDGDFEAVLEHGKRIPDLRTRLERAADKIGRPDQN